MRQLKITQAYTLRSDTVDAYLRDISRIPMITPDEEADLAALAVQGNEEAYNKLIEANLRFVVSVAKTMQGSGIALCDLINEGNIGLMKAARRFDPSKGFRFISYAVWWIRQQIMQSISDNARMIRLPLNQVGNINKISKASSKFFQENEREPTVQELAQIMDLGIDKIEESIAVSGRHASLDKPLGDDSDCGTLLDVTENPESPSADESSDKESLESDLKRAMSILLPREREIITYFFGIGCPEMSLEEIGQRMDLSRERVRQVKEKALRKLSHKEVKETLRQYL